MSKETINNSRGKTEISKEGISVDGQIKLKGSTVNEEYAFHKGEPLIKVDLSNGNVKPVVPRKKPMTILQKSKQMANESTLTLEEVCEILGGLVRLGVDKHHIYSLKDIDEAINLRADILEGKVNNKGELLDPTTIDENLTYKEPIDNTPLSTCDNCKRLAKVIKEYEDALDVQSQVIKDQEEKLLKSNEVNKRVHQENKGLHEKVAMLREDIRNKNKAYITLEKEHELLREQLEGQVTELNHRHNEFLEREEELKDKVRRIKDVNKIDPEFIEEQFKKKDTEINELKCIIKSLTRYL